MKAALFVASAASVLALSEPAFAETTFTVAYKTSGGAAAACPDRGAFIHEIQRRSQVAKPVGKEEQPQVVLVVDIKAQGKKVTGKLHITEGLKASERLVTGVTCNEVASALALIAALTIDPNAESIATPKPLPLPPDPAGPPILGTQPQLILGPAPVIVPTTSLPPLGWHPGLMPATNEMDFMAPPLPVDVVSPWEDVREEGLEVGVAARFLLDVGPGPTPMMGPGIQLEVRDLSGLPWSVRAELSYTLTTTTTAVDDLDTTYRMLRGRFIACFPAWEPTLTIRFWPCASFGGGGQWANVTRTADGLEQQETGPWLEAGASARLDFDIFRWLALELQAGPGFALYSAEFTNGVGPDARVLHLPSLITFQLGAGAAATF